MRVCEVGDLAHTYGNDNLPECGAVIACDTRGEARELAPLLYQYVRVEKDGDRRISAPVLKALSDDIIGGMLTEQERVVDALFCEYFDIRKRSDENALCGGVRRSRNIRLQEIAELRARANWLESLNEKETIEEELAFRRQQEGAKKGVS